jgi:signal transduction histidine kinase
LIPPPLRHDDVRVYQVLTDLVDNAGKFTAPSEVKVVVQAVGKMCRRLRFEVHDPGLQRF